MKTIVSHCLLLSVVSLSACATDPGDPGDGDDADLSVDTVERTVTGRWLMPATVLAVAEQQFVAYDEPPPWTGTSGCAGGLLAGTKELSKYLADTYLPAQPPGGYACRQNTANAAQTSVHGTGRAIDFFIPTIGGDADNTKGDAIANWLTTNAERVGIQLVIWDHSVWQASLSSNKLRAYGGPNPHVDHIHLELTKQAAARQTPWFTAPSPVWTSIVSADLDGDGNDELGFYRGTTGAFSWYAMTADGALGRHLGITTIGTGWSQIVSADVNGDGIDELGFYRASDGAFKFYHTTPTGALGTPLAGATLAKGWTQIVAGDFDGDGRDEVVFYRAGDGAFGVYGVTATGALGPALNSQVIGTGWTSLFVGDFDGNGNDELGFYQAGNGGIGVYDMTADGKLGTRVAGYAVGTGWGEVVASDLAGDGHDEIAFYADKTGAFVFYTATTTGQLDSNLNAMDLRP